MAKLHQIVAEINTRLTQAGGQFDSKKFQKGRFSGIAELITKVDKKEIRQTIPAIIDNSGDETKLTIDDSYPFELYHRHLTSTVTEIEADFGDRVIREETANMVLVVMGDRQRLKLNKEDIITGINLGMPVELGSAFLTANSLVGANIIQGEFNLNKEEVWNSEFNTEVGTKPSDILFSLSYQVVTKTWTTCIEICE
ncbi:hypothetical protein LCGC14_0463680 [marine sediment metagenome]|uniref:Uncharacterized protein n=1 Tax=marine sediment metagenome TaxID=412755 RepID=A0A0F9SE91_9ZZZZ